MKKLISILAIALMPSVVLAQVGSGIIIDNVGGGAGGGIVGVPPTTVGAIPRWLDAIGGSLGDSKWVLDTNSNMTATQPAIAGGVPKFFRLIGGSITNATASTETIDAEFNFGRTIQHAAGDYFFQRAFHINPPTYGYVGLSNINLMATEHIDGAPRVGTNANALYNTALLVGKMSLDFSGALSQAQATFSMPGIANSTGAINKRTILNLWSLGDVHLGDQVDQLDDLFGIDMAGLSFESTAARTVGQAAHIMMRGPYSNAGNVTFAYGPFGIYSKALGHLFEWNGVGAVDNLYALILRNDTQAAVGAQQNSPAQRFVGNQWNVGAAASHVANMQMQLVTPDAANDEAILRFSSFFDAAAPVAVLDLYTNASGHISSDSVLFDFLNASSFEVSESGKSMAFTVTDNGAFGPTLYLSLNTATPAANDIVGAINFFSYNNTPAQHSYGSIYSTIQSSVAAAERSSLTMSVNSATSMSTVWNGSGRTFDFNRSDDGISGALIRMVQTSASPAAGDSPGILIFSSDQDYARIRGMIDDPAALTGKGSLEFSVMQDTVITPKTYVNYHGFGVHDASPDSSLYVRSEPYNDFVVRIHPQDVAGLAAGASQTDIKYERATKTWDAGNFPVQVWAEFSAQNAAAAGASQIDDAILARFSNPTAGANMTFLRKYSVSTQNLNINGSQTVKVTDVNASPWNASQSDYFFGVSKTATGAVTLNLPAATTVGSIAYIVKDTGNNAAANNISVTPAGADTIDGVAAAKVMNANLSAYMFVSDGVSNWSVLKMF